VTIKRIERMSVRSEANEREEGTRHIVSSILSRYSLPAIGLDMGPIEWTIPCQPLSFRCLGIQCIVARPTLTSEGSNLGGMATGVFE
jgi:hypothetical protein